MKKAILISCVVYVSMILLANIDIKALFLGLLVYVLGFIIGVIEV